MCAGELNAFAVYHCPRLCCTSATKRGSKNEKELFVDGDVEIMNNLHVGCDSTSAI